jgi:hypothetical protein
MCINMKSKELTHIWCYSHARTVFLWQLIPLYFSHNAGIFLLILDSPYHKLDFCLTNVILNHVCKQAFNSPINFELHMEIPCMVYLDFFYCSLEILLLSWWIYLVLIVGEHGYLKWLITTHIVGYNALEIGLHIYVSKKRKRIEFKSELSYSNRLDIIYRELL